MLRASLVSRPIDALDRRCILSGVRPGEVIADRFVIERLAATGGMGQVFRARDRAAERPVALKVLLGAQLVDSARFRRESEMLAELSHPGIVHHVAHGVLPSGEPYLVMEWLDGEDLAARLARGRLNVRESVMIATQAAMALGAAHAQGIIHRDLKPRNLFLVEGQIAQVKLLDFGIARAHGATQMTQAGVLLGTPGYMAPEQARGEAPVDPRADVYALGCVLFECLAGRPVFRGHHAMAILAKILFEETPRLRDVLPDAPAELDALVGRMLAKDPAARPSDGLAAAAALAALGRLESAVPGEPRETAERPATLTQAEQRVLSVILIGADGAPGSSAEAPAPAAAPPQGALEHEAESFGGRLERLLDGSIVVTLGAHRMATDQAAIAARCALALGRRCPGRRLALTTGHGDATRRAPASDIIDRAAGMLAEAPGAWPAGSEAHPSPVAIDEVTAHLLDARFDVRESAAGFLLVGVRELSAGARSLLGRPTACVGRDRELTMLAQIFEGCLEEQAARAVLLVGQPGIGKSRLVHELIDQLEQRSPRVSIWAGRGDSLGAGSSFGLLAQVIRGACGIQGGEPLAARREKLRAAVTERIGGEDGQRVVEFLGELIGVPFPDGESAPLKAARKDAQLMNKQLRAAWEAFLRAECAARPLVLLLEDLHWGDLPTVSFIDEALRDVPEGPWMVLAVARPEVRQTFPGLWEGRSVQVIHLQPLGRKAGERLIRQVLGDTVSPDTVQRLVEQADGNPFYLEELVRATARRRGEALPETVVAMVQSRLGALDAELRRVLRAASVLGEVFWAGAVAALLGGRGDGGSGDGMRAVRVRDLLAELVEQEVLVRRPASRFADEEELGFRHALLREGAYAMLVEEDRALGHRLAGEWRERRGEHDPVVLAEHFARGGVPERAVAFYRRAAEQALATADLGAVVTYAQRGLACAPPEEARIEFLGLLCESFAWQGQWQAAVPYADELLERAWPGSVPWVRARSARLVSLVYQLDGEGLIAELRALEAAEPAPAALGQMVLTACAGIYHLYGSGRRDVAEPLLGRLHAIVSPRAAEEPLAAAWLACNEAFSAGYLNEEPWRGLSHALAVRPRFAEMQHAQGLLIAGVSVGMNLWLLGAYERAEEELRAILIQGEDLTELTSIRRFILACLLARRGAFAEALDEAKQLCETGHARRLPNKEGRGHWALAEVLRRMGDLDAAEREARVAIEQLAVTAVEQLAAITTLGAVLHAQGRLDEAHRTITEAMARYRALGACGFCRGPALHLLHVECLRALGEEEPAAAALGEAREHLLGLATRIEDSAYRASFLEQIPEHARLLALARP